MRPHRRSRPAAPQMLVFSHRSKTVVLSIRHRERELSIILIARRGEQNAATVVFAELSALSRLVLRSPLFGSACGAATCYELPAVVLKLKRKDDLSRPRIPGWQGEE